MVLIKKMTSLVTYLPLTQIDYQVFYKIFQCIWQNLNPKRQDREAMEAYSCSGQFASAENLTQGLSKVNKSGVWFCNKIRESQEKQGPGYDELNLLSSQGALISDIGPRCKIWARIQVWILNLSTFRDVQISCFGWADTPSYHISCFGDHKGRSKWLTLYATLNLWAVVPQKD